VLTRGGSGDPEGALPCAVWLASGLAHLETPQVITGPGPELLKLKWVCVVPKANIAMVTIVRLNTNVGVVIN
jgi:hypothetical protein